MLEPVQHISDRPASLEEPPDQGTNIPGRQRTQAQDPILQCSGCCELLTTIMANEAPILLQIASEVIDFVGDTFVFITVPMDVASIKSSIAATLCWIVVRLTVAPVLLAVAHGRAAQPQRLGGLAVATAAAAEASRQLLPCACRAPAASMLRPHIDGPPEPTL